jgi:predicted RNA methylase
MDKFYTKQDIAEQCCKTFAKVVKVDYNHDMIIEPSAGSGAFIPGIKQMCKNTLFIDIAPDNKIIKKADFLDLHIDTHAYKNIYVVGNPPFGFRSSMAIKFIKKACKFCTAFAFILPRSFAKASMKRSVPLAFHLRHQTILPPDAFHGFNVPCVFQVWVKHPEGDLRKVPGKVEPLCYEFTDAPDADIAIRRVGSKAGQVYYTDLKKRNKNTHYFVKLHKKMTIQNINSVTMFQVTGPLSLSKQMIIKGLNNECIKHIK